MEDLSHLTERSLAGAGSMAASNTVSVPPAFAPEGSASESVSPDDVRPEPDHIPSMPPQPRTVLHPGGAPRIGSPWHRADGTQWEDAEPDESGGNASSTDWPQS